jgi:hypothetical protein
LLVLACGYLFTALIVVPYALTFPGAFSPSGLLGAGLQTAPWLYWFWHAAWPIAAIAYVWFNGEERKPGTVGAPNAAASIGWSVVIVISAIVGLTLLTTAGEAHLPIIMRDRVEVNLGILRWRFVLDLWLVVTCCSMLFELLLGTFFASSRYSAAWYTSRIYAYAASIFVLMVLLSVRAPRPFEHVAASRTNEQADEPGGCRGLYRS